MLILALLCVLDPVVIDSRVYSVDADRLVVQELDLRDDVIDHLVDDYLYVLTRRYLHKIDRTSLMFLDHLLLPQRFNYLAATRHHLHLVGTQEIVVVDKENFSYRNGVGIEPGDYRPLFAMNDADDRAYLVTDSDTKSQVLIVDPASGRVARRTKVARVLAWHRDRAQGQILGLDIAGNIVWFDRSLKMVKKTSLPVRGSSFQALDEGWLVQHAQGLCYCNAHGALVDVQPLPTRSEASWIDYLALYERALVVIDPLALRVKGYNDAQCFRDIELIDDRHAIGRTETGGLHLIDLGSATTRPLTVESVARREGPAPARADRDSLWYLQLGAFSRYENAAALSAGLLREGVPAFVDSLDLFRVKLGGFGDKGTASAVSTLLNVPAWPVLQPRRPASGPGEFTLSGERYRFKDGIITKE